MQLSPPAVARQRQLAIAVLALLGASAAHAGSPEPVVPPGSDRPAGGRGEDDAASRPQAYPPATIDTGLLYYQENDGRVSTGEAVVSVRQPLHGDTAFGLKLLLDAVTGGTPNGAIPSRQVQTFATPSATTLSPPSTPVQTTTSASGGSLLCGSHGSAKLYTVAPGQLPLDKSFCDQRIALSGDYGTPLGAQGRVSLGAALSHENDFMSASVNAAFAQDFDSRNTTLSAGVNLEHDAVNPIGGAPVPLSDYARFQKQGNKSRQVGDLLLGVTQIVSRRWIAQFNLSLDRSSGYENDPYKIVTVVDTAGNLGSPLAYFYESRPGQRLRKALYWDNKVSLDHDVVQASYRYMTDDWGVRSHTLEMHYRWTLAGEGSYLEPHLRAYRQSAASFYRLYHLQGDPLGGDVSADPRLARFDAQTIGLKFGTPLWSGSEFGFRVERYVQRPAAPGSLPAGLQGLDLNPALSAWIVQAGMRFQF